MRQISTSQFGAMIGRPGGQGTVYELVGEPNLLAKIYHAVVQLDPDGLEALVGWRRGLGRPDLAMIDQATSWPLDTLTVTEDGRLGVVIPRAPDRFFHTVNGSTIPRDISWAYLADAVRFAGLEPARPAAAARVVRQLAGVYDVFNRNGVAYGDLSHTNALWSGGARPDVYLIDCDAAAVSGHPRALVEAQTPLWDCPWPAVQGQERDLYKLALAFLRLVMRYEGPLGENVRSLTLPAHPPVTVDTADLLEAGLREAGIRPSPAAWIPVLECLEKGLRARKIA